MCIAHASFSQFLMDMLDTTTNEGKGLLHIVRNFDHLKLSGYIQPQFQVAEQKGIESFEGGDFAPRVSNRFMFRRSRVKIDYAHFGNERSPDFHIVFQFDANERGFTVRDVWGRVFENRFKLFSFTTGMFARPFGYEVNLSSSDRESPERGRMSQILMKSERDLGAMVSFDSRKKNGALNFLKMDLGLFNGQGINAQGDFDNYKDLIGRIYTKPIEINNLSISGGASILYGGLENSTKYIYTTVSEGGIKNLQVDSSLSNIGSRSPRKYFGADAQLKLKNKKGFTQLRGEIIAGKQSGTVIDSETPTRLPEGMEGFHVRNFRGGYAYFIQDLFSPRHSILVKYDVYDPNTDVSGGEIGATGTGFTKGDIKYQTVGVGYLNHITPNVKLLAYYAMVKNESTNLPGFTSDVNDDVFTLRIQFRF